MVELETWANRSKFSYVGSVEAGIEIKYGNGIIVKISSNQLRELLNHFRGKAANIGTSRSNPPRGSVGEWLQDSVKKRSIASYVGPILIHEGYATKIGSTPIIEFRNVYPGEK